MIEKVESSVRYSVLYFAALRQLRSLTYVVTAAVVVWLFHDHGPVLRFPALILDFPVALAGRILPGCEWVTGIDMFFGMGVGEWMPSETQLVWHLRASIVVYYPLFWAVGGIRRLLRSRTTA